ncbi:MAG: hypothetical protein RLZZ522_3 [Verrucomicrobiota bacterium]
MRTNRETHSSSSINFAAMKRSSLPSLFALVFAAMLLPSAVSAQWVREAYPLKPGWNAIWLSQDCSVGIDGSTRAIGDVLAANPQILEVWRWNPLGSTVQWTQAPENPIAPDATWAVWRRADPDNSTLGTLTGNSSYLVNVAPGATAFELQLTGKPLPPNYEFNSAGLNFIGFPTQATGAVTQPNFDAFFSYSPVLKSAPSVFFYNGGPLSDVNPKNPLLVGSPRFTAVSRGKAYWVRSTAYSDYYGPLKVTVLGTGGIEYGRKLNTVAVRVKNVTDPLKNATITATFTLANSAQAPDGTQPDPVPLRVRGPRDANLQFTYSTLPATLTLAPGEEKELILDAHRAMMNIPDHSYESILRVTDSLQHTRIDLPVSAVGSSRQGIWVGAAVLNSVNRVETISGPEFDAPVGTPNGAGPESVTTVTTVAATGNGLTTRATTFQAAFDSAGDHYLATSGLTAANLTVTGTGGTPVYVPTTDFTIARSQRATVTNGGRDYTAAPIVTLSGGGGSGASATATLDASVRSVTMTQGGAGYTAAPAVTFVGGGGAGASGMAVIDAQGGIVTDVRITHGGSGYTSPPAVVITGGGGTTPALAQTKIAGRVGIVTITAGGTGYTAAPTVAIAAVDGNGSGAAATVELSGGAIAGVDVIHKKETGTIGATAQVTVPVQREATSGTPDGTVASTITSISKLVTLNGKSHLSTRRVSSGGDSAAPSNFPIRLILHAPGSGRPVLLQQVYLGQRNGIAYAGPREATVAALVTAPGPTPAGNLGRASSASFPLGGRWTADTGTWGGSASFTVTLGHDEASNPFLHSYHPDHDNWDARYEHKLAAGRESYQVNRSINLTFDSALPVGISDLNWGVTTLGGTYSEIITGLRSEQIEVSGSFILHQVSEVSTLTP